MSSRGRACRFEAIQMRPSTDTFRHSARGGEVNLCEVGEEGKKSNACESSEQRRSDKSTVCCDMVVDEKEVRRGSYPRDCAL